MCLIPGCMACVQFSASYCTPKQSRPWGPEITPFPHPYSSGPFLNFSESSKYSALWEAEGLLLCLPIDAVSACGSWPLLCLNKAPKRLNTDVQTLRCWYQQVSWWELLPSAECFPHGIIRLWATTMACPTDNLLIYSKTTPKNGQRTKMIHTYPCIEENSEYSSLVWI